MLAAAGAIVSAAFYLFTPEAGEIITRGTVPGSVEITEYPDSGETETSAGSEAAGFFEDGFTEIQKEQIEDIVRSCLSSVLEKAVSESVRSVITELRDDGTLAEALASYADSQSGRININRAEADELRSLPGIGEAKASAIIRYREENGDFKSVDELINVSGISEKILESIRNDITV